AYFTRGSGHNDKAGYTEREDDYINNVDRLSRKFDSIRKASLAPIVDYSEKASIGFVAAGTSQYAVDESRYQLRKEYNVETSYLRLRSYPYNQDLVDFI